MPIKHSMNNLSMIKCSAPETYLVVLRAESNGTSAPDGNDPTAGVTWDQTATGVYTVTFSGKTKPHRILWSMGYVEEDLPSEHLRFISYVASTGVATIHGFKEDAVTGISAKADVTTDKTMTLLLLCTDSSLNDA